jgi:hypothetical protein
MKKTLLLSLGIISLVVIFISCSKDGGSGGSGGSGGGGGTPDCSAVTNKSFSADVNPIVQSTCNAAACHASGSFNGPGSITNYTEVFNNRVAIRAAIASGTMPKNTTLSTSQKNSILCWIYSGAPNN